MTQTLVSSFLPIIISLLMISSLIMNLSFIINDHHNNKLLMVQAATASAVNTNNNQLIVKKRELDHHQHHHRIRSTFNKEIESLPESSSSSSSFLADQWQAPIIASATNGIQHQDEHQGEVNDIVEQQKQQQEVAIDQQRAHNELRSYLAALNRKKLTNNNNNNNNNNYNNNNNNNNDNRDYNCYNDDYNNMITMMNLNNNNNYQQDEQNNYLPLPPLLTNEQMQSQQQQQQQDDFDYYYNLLNTNRGQSPVKYQQSKRYHGVTITSEQPASKPANPIAPILIQDSSRFGGQLGTIVEGSDQGNVWRASLLDQRITPTQHQMKPYKQFNLRHNFNYNKNYKNNNSNNNNNTEFQQQGNNLKQQQAFIRQTKHGNQIIKFRVRRPLIELDPNNLASSSFRSLRSSHQQRPLSPLETRDMQQMQTMTSINTKQQQQARSLNSMSNSNLNPISSLPSATLNNLTLSTASKIDSLKASNTRSSDQIINKNSQLQQRSKPTQSWLTEQQGNVPTLEQKEHEGDTTLIDQLVEQRQASTMMSQLTPKFGIELEPGDPITCKTRKYTYRAVKTDTKGNKCWDQITANVCYGRCDSGEIADWLFPHKKSIHYVCVHKDRIRRRTRLSQCTSVFVDPELRLYHYIDAVNCACQKCSSSDAVCRGGLVVDPPSLT